MARMPFLGVLLSLACCAAALANSAEDVHSQHLPRRDRTPPTQPGWQEQQTSGLVTTRAPLHESTSVETAIQDDVSDTGHGNSQRLRQGHMMLLPDDFQPFFPRALRGLGWDSFSATDSEPEPTPVIAYWRLSFVVLLLIIPLAVSAWIGLGLHWSLALAGLRCGVQLMALGYVLKFIFSWDRWWVVAGYIIFMLSVTSAEAFSRPKGTYIGMGLHLLIAVGVPSVFMLFFLLLLVIAPGKGWFSAQYSIPIMGMMLGNTLNGVSMGMSMLVDALQIERAEIEWALAMGATRAEAIWPIFARVVKNALMPLVNSLSVAGLVSIPGMMTGQILAGDDASLAARYQVMIMFAIAATSTGGCILSTSCAASVLLDRHHRLRLDRLKPRTKRKAFAAWWRAQATQAWETLRAVAGGSRPSSDGGDRATRRLLSTGRSSTRSARSSGGGSPPRVLSTQLSVQSDAGGDARESLRLLSDDQLQPPRGGTGPP